MNADFFGNRSTLLGLLPTKLLCLLVAHSEGSSQPPQHYLPRLRPERQHTCHALLSLQPHLLTRLWTRPLLSCQSISSSAASPVSAETKTLAHLTVLLGLRRISSRMWPRRRQHSCQGNGAPRLDVRVDVQTLSTHLLTNRDLFLRERYQEVSRMHRNQTLTYRWYNSRCAMTLTSCNGTRVYREGKKGNTNSLQHDTSTSLTLSARLWEEFS